MKKIFSYNVDIGKNAYLNWRMTLTDASKNLSVMAESFADAAKTMLDVILADNSDKKADSLIFPILYSIDQAIELYLKAILRELEILSKVKPSNYNTHDIKELYHNMVSQIKRKECRTKGLGKHLQAVEDYIDELYLYITTDTQKTPKIDFARYPIDTSGCEHFYIGYDNVVIDIENLKIRFCEIEVSLSSLYAMYQNELEEN